MARKAFRSSTATTSGLCTATPCHFRHSPTSEKFLLIEQAQTKRKTTGYEVCKESESPMSVWDGGAPHPTDGIPECTTAVHLFFKQGSYPPGRAMTLPVQVWRMLLKGPQTPLEQLCPTGLKVPPRLLSLELRMGEPFELCPTSSFLLIQGGQEKGRKGKRKRS